ncbi:Uncharacterised protein [Staphylococcus saprophyticus]|nr:Uncharacterised protein [Staphylococcus saprophyticus]SUM76400.1 Uncharacterised protein [Staphylococcus saprophyticus]SUM86558.1 Uncharacterised protein [Staphylococcus saprophyticus]VDZ21517.1 Uncharacterised protein [Staphylococcus saprophyticus]
MIAHVTTFSISNHMFFKLVLKNEELKVGEIDKI